VTVAAHAPPPEIRIDQLTGLRTILAPARADRPDAFAAPAPAPHPDAETTCPFCEGHEDRTPPEVWADRPDGGAPDTPGWRVRAVPNLYPVLGADAAENARGPADRETGFSALADPLRASTRGAEADLFRALPAVGGHEVIVSAPRHVTAIAALTEAELATVVAGWRERMRVRSERASYVHLIVNEGPDAGASLEHSHAQLYALGFVPTEIARERERAAAYHQRTMGGHLLADVAVEEVRRRERLVAIDDEAMLICPWASRAPFELRVIPRRPTPGFERDGEVGTAMLRQAVLRLERLFGRSPQLNLWVRTAPRGIEEFCWHVDVVPRLTIRAGFELGTGVEVNIYPPERAAADLREAVG
jgi:UDPglucose--hexose-1-phosphate uridylyltransferase